MIKDSHLLKIKTLSKNIAKQVQLIDYSADRNSKHSQIALALHPEKGNVKEAEAIGWVDGSTLFDVGVRHASRQSKYLLVLSQNQLVWLLAPRKGEAFDYYMTGRLEQIFV